MAPDLWLSTDNCISIFGYQATLLCGLGHTDNQNFERWLLNRKVQTKQKINKTEKKKEKKEKSKQTKLFHMNVQQLALKMFPKLI